MTWWYEVEDYPAAEASERTLCLTVLGRTLTVSWQGPLRGHTRKGFSE